jgi:hypothetical protein
MKQEEIYGRGERIRTSDSCVPNAVLYQAELHPEADEERVSREHAQNNKNGN